VEKIPHPSELVAPIDYTTLAPAALTAPHAVAALPGARSHLGIAYATAIGWRPLRLDLHVPDRGSGPFPVVVYAHGGSFVGGIPAMGPWHTLPAHGIAVASVGYRLAGEVHFPDPVEDVRAAIRWVRAHATAFGLDAARVAGWGSSAGAYLMTMAGLAGDEPLGRAVGDDLDQPSALTAVVDHYGGSDLSRVREDALPGSTEEQLTGIENVVRRFLGFDPHREPARAAAADPTALASRRRGGPPFLIMHGDADRRVGPGQSRRLHDALTAAGVRSELVVVAGADHAAPEFAAPDAVRRVLGFLQDTWGGDGR
jgi:acetyl esterase/lipase